MKELIIPPLRLKQIEISQEPLLVEDEAKEAYKAAIKIEPDNQAYKQLLSDLE